MSGVIELVPPGTFIFMDRRINPAEQWPGTVWEEYANELYISSEEEQGLDNQGRPTNPHTVLICWMRIS